jgi:phage-related protein
MIEPHSWKVEFYLDARGKNPVLEFINSLAPKERAVVLRVIDLLEEYGTALRMPHARPVGDLWELRAGAGRIFYVAIHKRRLLLLHGYRKQSQKAPQQEIEMARRRLYDFLEREI